MIRLIKQKHKILDITDDALTLMEYAGRTCTNKVNKMTLDSSEKFVSNLIKMDHMAMIEFADLSVEFITDRTVSHELVRHRLASFAQESQRYVKYDVIDFILPPWLNEKLLGEWDEKRLQKNHLELTNIEFDYIKDCLYTYSSYHFYIHNGWKPEQARKKLTGDVATTIIVKANFREWIHIFNLRYKGTTGRPDPTMHVLMEPLFQEMSEKYNIIFK